jgi:hypothetical protein
MPARRQQSRLPQRRRRATAHAAQRNEMQNGHGANVDWRMPNVE